jgi:predicted 3-demethylubiquinone-9 3-methyltransferase (glyoxalase superfamily)
MHKIVPHFWFDHQAEEAAQFYTSIFQNTAIDKMIRYGREGFEVHGQPEGTVMTVDFQLEGQPFIALNGGPVFQPNPSISHFVNCTTENDVDKLWEALSREGNVLMPLDSYPFSEKYGWVEDKYGLSWQLILNPEADQKIVPALLFVGDQCGKAKEAVYFYTSIFNDSTIGTLFPYGSDQQENNPEHLAHATFALMGQSFIAMDSGLEHDFGFSEAISLLVYCENQAEVDYLWEKLSADPDAEQCGWLKDPFGVSWQIVPKELYRLMEDPDPVKAGRVMEAILKMKKLEIDLLQKAYAGE